MTGKIALDLEANEVESGWMHCIWEKKEKKEEGNERERLKKNFCFKFVWIYIYSILNSSSARIIIS